jgi:two-component system sensor histidine kinase RegB
MLYKVGALASVLAGMLFLALYAWRLAKESRQMADALAATEMVLAREQQLHALDGLAAAAAHELGTPLATIAVASRELERSTYDSVAFGSLPQIPIRIMTRSPFSGSVFFRSSSRCSSRSS